MEQAIGRLVELGLRQGGQLGLDQVQAELPVDEMGVGELARVLERIEATGVTVEVEDALLRRPRTAPEEEERAEAVVLPFPGREDQPVTVRPVSFGGDASEGARPATGAPARTGGEPAIPVRIPWLALALLAAVAVVAYLLSR